MGFGSGVVDPDTGIHYQNRGSYFSLDPSHPNVLAPGKRTLHTLLPGMLFRAGERRPWIVTGSMGGDAQPQVHAQVVSALVDGGVDVATAVGAPRWFVDGDEHFAPPVNVRAERRYPADVLDALEAMGHPVTRTIPFNGALGHAHAIELVDGGPGRPPTVRSPPPPTRAAQGCRRSGSALQTRRPQPRGTGSRPQQRRTRGRTADRFVGASRHRRSAATAGMAATAFVAEGRRGQGAVEDRSERSSDVRERGPSGGNAASSFRCDRWHRPRLRSSRRGDEGKAPPRTAASATRMSVSEDRRRQRRHRRSAATVHVLDSEPPVAGCAHTTPPPALPLRSQEPSVSSNVGQSYPYTSETEADRATRIGTLVAEREGLSPTTRGRDDGARRERALVGLEVPDRGLPGPPPRRGLRGREARPVRRLRRDLREDVPPLSSAHGGATGSSRRIAPDVLRAARRRLSSTASGSSSARSGSASSTA